MKYISLIFLLFFMLLAQAQDSIVKKPKFNYFEFSIASQHNFSITDDYVPGPFFWMPYPKFEINTPAFYHNTWALNTGIKLGRHKLIVGALYAPVLNGYFWSYSDYGVNNSFLQNLNFSANYFFYLSKKQKKANHFVNLFYQTQGMNDFTTKNGDFEFKRIQSFGLSYGISFYIKHKLLIEPSLFIKANFMENKDVYTYTTFTTITTKTEIQTFRTYHMGISLKLGYTKTIRKN